MKRLGTPSGCLLFVLLATALGLTAGCGDGRPQRVPVAGTVTVDGKPLTAGFIRVVPDDARPATGKIDADGRFRLTTFDERDGCVTGTHRVEVIAFDTISPSTIRWLVPPKYRDTSTSGLTVTVDGPIDSLAIELSWQGGKPYVERFETAGDTDPSQL